MVGYMAADWFGQAVVGFLGFLNYGVYSLVREACMLIINISETTFNDELLGNLQTRIYIILAIYMLFKLAFSLLSSIVNPDMLLDKEKGMQKIIPRTIIALVMLVMFPTVFNYAMDWQSDIVEFIPRVIIGRTVNLDDDEVGSIADSLAGTALSAFVSPNSECGEGSDVESTDLDAVLTAAKETCSTSRKVFKYEFSGLISLIVGFILVFILVSYCVDIAIRVLKLGILKILSPIPIISYIDPKSEKSGAFSKWMNEAISTYIELFIKMGILYFVLFVLGNISNNDVSIFNYADTAGPFAKVVIIIGAFFFMGKAADFICNILGVKKPEKNGGFLKGLAGIGAAVGIGAAAISSGLTNYRGSLASQKANGVTTPSKGKAIASAMLGAGMGVATAGKAVAGAKSGKMGAALAAANKRNTAYATAAASGATLGGKASSYFQRAFTGETIAEKTEKEIAILDEQAKSASAIVSHADEKAKTSKYTTGISELKDAKGNVIKKVSGNYQQWTAAFNAAKAQGLKGFSFNGTNVTMEEAERLDYGLFTSNSDYYIKKQGTFRDSNNKILATDEVFEQKIADSIANNPNFVFNDETTRGDVKEYIDKVNVEKSKKTRDLKVAKANADATKPK